MVSPPPNTCRHTSPLSHASQQPLTLILPTGLSEEQITDIFSTAGKVLNFRLVYDRETGRPKGFGFAEYPDAGTFSLQKLLPFQSTDLIAH